MATHGTTSAEQKQTGERQAGSKTHADGPARTDLQSVHEASAEGMSDSDVLRHLWAFVMPSEKPEFKTRVAASMALLVASKGLTIAVSSLTFRLHFLNALGRCLCKGP